MWHHQMLVHASEAEKGTSGVCCLLDAHVAESSVSGRRVDRSQVRLLHVCFCVFMACRRSRVFVQQMTHTPNCCHRRHSALQAARTRRAERYGEELHVSVCAVCLSSRRHSIAACSLISCQSQSRATEAFLWLQVSGPARDDLQVPIKDTVCEPI